MSTRGNLFAILLVATVLLPQPARAADVAYGEYLANECVTCHQKTGNYSGIPSITGWPPEAFVQALNAYRWRERKNPIMQTIADQLNDADMAALAAYFEQLGPPQISIDEPPARNGCPEASKTC
jgi:cytochrome c553